jgi:hypothetical protein
MTDRALRVRLDVDVRGDDEVGLGATRTGPPGPPARDGEVALVLGVTLARHVLATLPPARRVPVARDLAALDASDAAADLIARRVPGALVHDLRAEEQVGARGWCARAVLGEGAGATEALVAVDAIRLPAGAWTDDWASRAPWMVPALVRHVTGDAPDTLARTVIALRTLGEAIAADPAAADDPATATHAAVVALGTPPPIPGAAAFVPVSPSTAETTPLAAPAPPPPPRAPVAPAAAAATDRRLVAMLAAAIGTAALSLFLVFAIIAAPGWFGLARADEVNDRVAVIQAEVGRLRTDVGTLARDIQGSGGTPAQRVDELRRSLDELQQQVRGLCSVLPVVC